MNSNTFMLLTFLRSYCLTFIASCMHVFAFSQVFTLNFSNPNPAFTMVDYLHPDFKLQYPETWDIDTSRQWGAEVMLFAPLENDSDKFRENVNVVIQDLTGLNIDLDIYKQITDQQITTLAPDGVIIESSIIASVRGKHYRITYTMTQDIFRLKITSVCFIHKDKAYLLTFTAELDKYEEYKKVGDAILDSFSMIK